MNWPTKQKRRRSRTPLTTKRVEKLLRNGTVGRYLDRGDGRNGNQVDPVRGFYLVINGKAAAHWELRYQLHNKTHFMGLGSARDFNLTEARERAKAARQKLADKIDPLEAKRAEREKARREVANNLTFKQAAQEFLQVHEATWKNDKHRLQWNNTLKQYAFPKLGDRPLHVIDAHAINDALRPIWTTIPETASRTKQRVERVVQWVKNGKPLPTAQALRRTKNQPALPYAELSTFLTDLRPRDGIAARALEFLILTAARTNEVIGAQRREFDFTRKVWTIPAARMKAEVEHRVPLSECAIELLRALPIDEGNEFMFAGAKEGKGLSNMALAETIRQLNEERTRRGEARYVDPKQDNRDIVPHGFRSTFRTWAADRTRYPRDISEAALAHTVKGVEGVYQRGDLFDKRRRLMTDWTRFCVRAPRKAGAEIQAHHEARA